MLGVAREVWNRLKTWRQIRFGPVSVIYRFRRTVSVSKNRRPWPANHQSLLASALGSVVTPLGPSFFESPAIESFPRRNQDSTDVAIIFGVGPGLGFALARRLVKHGGQVALVSRQAEHLRNLAVELNSQPSGGRATVYSCDVTDERGVREVLSLVVRELGTPNLVVYSTQNSVAGPAIDMTTAAFEECWRTNCLGGFIVAREAAQIMRPHHAGSIILIGSTSGLVGRENHLSLAVGKFGLRAITQVMARELWSEGLHVAHVIIDADIDDSDKDPSQISCNPNDVADVIYSVHRQPSSAWASEIDVRPARERFWEHC